MKRCNKTSIQTLESDEPAKVKIQFIIFDIPYFTLKECQFPFISKQEYIKPEPHEITSIKQSFLMISHAHFVKASKTNCILYIL